MIYTWLLELETALTAAGLDTRITFAPDRGPGVVIGAPSLAWDDHVPRVACGEPVRGDVSVIVHVIAQGWAPEQLEQQLSDAEDVLDAIPAAWRPREMSPAPGDTTLPEYRITIER